MLYILDLLRVSYIINELIKSLLFYSKFNYYEVLMKFQLH